ncbi:MAG: tetratricopeptide repeat protein, partial [Gemmatimonadetes bacterium]|nr:tetratricopeptide repeat protein [Gemmatimonadota bacterium]
MPRSLLSELKRRNVWRAAALYAAAAWLLVQVATQVFPFFDVPAWVVRAIIVASVLGFPFWIAFAWLYELTPEGLKRESEVDPAQSITPQTGKRLDRWIIGILSAAVVLLLANTFVWHKGGVLGGRDAGSAAPDAASGSRATAAPAAPLHSIAVLPFENLSTDKEQEYFADGISEDLLDLLTKVPALRVAARTSSFSFKGQHLEVPEIARRLNVANVLQGSVRWAGDRVRITAQLVRAADGYQVWSQIWDRKLGDVFQVQDEIASDVVKELRVTLLGAAAPQARETDPRAYALYLQARELGRGFSRESLLRSDSLYRQVLAIDPRYAPAWTELATNIVNETGIIGVLPNEEGLRRARELAAKAVAIDPGYALAHAGLGYLASLEGDLARAAREYERALALDSTDPRVLGNSTALLSSLGRVKEAIAVMEYVVEREPVNVTGLYNLGLHYLAAGRYDDAIARLRTA